MKMILKRVFFVLLLTLLFLFYIYHMMNPFFNEISIEAGSKIELKQLLKRNTNNVKIVNNLSQKQYRTLGVHKLRVQYYFLSYEINVVIKDTIAPKAKVNNLEMWVGDQIEASDFISQINDQTDVDITFENKPDISKEGNQTVGIILKDAANNKTKYKAILTLKKDTEPPFINTVNTILSNMGETISYKNNVVVTDNRDKNISLNIDSSEVNYNKPGTYYVRYAACDLAGNESSKKVKVIILTENDMKVKIETLKLADQFIKKVVKNQKTKQDIIEQCFDYIRKHFKYNGLHQGNFENYYIDARTGFKTLTGDCLVSNGMLRVICERLDIPTMIVERTSVGRPNHYWILADTGDGWYHYDAFNQKHRIYKWTDDHLIAWSKQNHHYQDFDQSRYPSTPKK